MVNIIETGWDYIQLGMIKLAIKGRIDEFTIWNNALNATMFKIFVSQDQF